MGPAKAGSLPQERAGAASPFIPLPEPPRARVFPSAVLFSLAIGLGAALLFAMQPMLARMALPTLGGTPAVWNVCMVFFQACVLAGYALAHGLARRLSPAAQAWIFVMILAAAAATLPPAISPPAPTLAETPLPWLIGNLAAQAALPAAGLAVASPLLQRWFAVIHDRAAEPYFLYAASNAGSFAALLAYPLLLERLLPLDRQAAWWTAGFVGWTLLIACCGARILARRRTTGFASDAPASSASVPETRSKTRTPPARRLAWIALAAIPASLLQGCTLFLTTDLASVPLLWVIPLALYLLTFVIAFGRGTPWVRAANRALPFLGAALLYAILARSTQPVFAIIGLHLAFLFAAGLVCHGRLVALRPPPEHLTGFYLALALGGVLGGSVNSLIAPLLLDSLLEYPLAIALACTALPLRAHTSHPARASIALDVAWALAPAALTLALAVLADSIADERTRNVMVFAPAAVACCALLDRPRRLTLAMAAVFIAGFLLHARWTGVLHSERNFFGITRVTHDPTGATHQLVHGNTFHGRQFIDPALRAEPLTYYHRRGPLGAIMAEFQSRPGPRRIGVIGLGVGSMAAYATPEEDWTFLEIDPAVIDVATRTNWFTFLRESHARSIEIIEGDARLRLEELPDTTFDLLVLDAFSSDAIPVHLLTREALALYLRKLQPDGWIVAHISNRYLDLESVWAALAADAGIASRTLDDPVEGDYRGKEPSHWVLLAREPEHLGALRSRWWPAENHRHVRPWTDQHSSLLQVMDWY